MHEKTGVLGEARRLYVLGAAILWLHPKSKRPVKQGWTTGPRDSWKDLLSQYREGMNVGVRLGEPSKMEGGYLAVIDVDVKSKELKHREEALTAAQNILSGKSSPIVSSGRGGGSSHHYIKTQKPFKTYKAAASKDLVRVFMPSEIRSSVRDREMLTSQEIDKGYRIRNAWEIGVMSNGSQVVVPPSIHPDSGKSYKWVRNIGNGLALPTLPYSLLTPPQSDKTKKDSTGLITSQDFKVTPVELAWLPISDTVRNGILTGQGVSDRSGFLLRATTALTSAGLTENEILTILTDPETFIGACAYEHAGGTRSRTAAAAWVYKYTLKKVQSERSVGTIFNAPLKSPNKLSPAEMAKQAKEFEEERHWTQDLDHGPKGGTKITLKNLDLILTHGVNGNVFVEDLFASRIQYGADTPWGGKEKAFIEDIDMLLIKRWFADTQFGIEPSKEIIYEATSVIAHRCGVHPVREWLLGLEWDGKPRINSWIRDYCQGVAKEPYLSQVSRKFLVAMVKRIFEPGCQWDYVLILEGMQGKFKSSIARALAGDRWFMDNLPDLKDKDSMLNLQGKWLIELGELADVKRADYNLVKAYLVRRSDTVRRHYGRIQSEIPRQSVFIGTINEGQYLKDPTGNRRYWPVKVGRCNVDALKAVRDQLFAEAVALYKGSREILTLDNKGSAQAKEAQEERRVDDDESEMREAFLRYTQSPKGENFPHHKFNVHENLMIGVDAPWGRWNGARGNFYNTAAHVLRSLGYDSKKSSQGARCWKKVNGTAVAPIEAVPPEEDFY